MSDLSKRVLVTGANRGLGEAIARGLDALGHRTVLVGRDEAALTRLARELSSAQVLAQDLAETEQLAALVETAASKLGGLDGLVNNAGVIEPMGTLDQLEPAAWERAMRINLSAPAMLMAAALPYLRRSRAGRIVNISSGAAVKPTPGWGAYCTAKAGLLALASVVAAEEKEVACFSLRPGVIDTGMQQEIRESQAMPKAAHARFLDLHQQGKLEPAEVPAKAAIWLLLHGPVERSGELIEYTDAKVQAGVAKLFS